MHDEDTVIELPLRAKQYLADKLFYVQDGLPTYSEVVGEDPLPLPANLQDEKGYRLSQFEVRNKNHYATRDAHDAVRRIISEMFMVPAQSIGRIQRHYMLLGGTMPIKLEVDVGKHSCYIVYVKRPDSARIFGKILYNMLSGLEEQDFLFGDAIYIERRIVGYHPDVDTLPNLLNHGLFVPNLVRLAALDELLKINDLTEIRGEKEQYVNIIVTAAIKAAAFDFDLLFEPDKDEPKLVEFMRTKGWRIPVSLEHEILAAERAELRSRLGRNTVELFRIAGLMDEIEDLHSRIMRLGYDSYQDYFILRTSELTSTIPRNGSTN